MTNGSTGDPQAVFFFHFHFRPGGLERVFLNLILGLDRRRFRPVLLLRDSEGGFLDLLPGDVEIVGLTAKRLRWAVPNLVRIFNDRQPALVVTGDTVTNLVALAAARASRSKPPILIAEHTPLSLIEKEVSGRRSRALAMRLLYAGAAAMVVPAPGMIPEFEAVLGTRQPPISALPNPAIDRSAEARMAEALAVPLEAPSIVSAGRLSAEKAFDVLIRAAHLMRFETPRPTFHILGDGPERPRLERLIAELELTDQIRLHGIVLNPYPYLAAADVVAMSSRREACNTVLLEAMTCGTPVVTTHCWPGADYVVNAGRAGSLVPTDEPEALADAIRELLTHPTLVDRLVREGKEWSRQFRVEAAIPAYETLFDRAIRGITGPDVVAR